MNQDVTLKQREGGKATNPELNWKHLFQRTSSTSLIPTALALHALVL